MKISRRWREPVQGLIAMCCGTALVFGSILFMNGASEDPKSDPALANSGIVVERKEKPKPRKVVRKQERPKPAPRRSAAPPSAGLAGNLSGLDLGLPDFGGDELGNLAGDLLGDAGDVVMTDDSVDVAPRPIAQGPMIYPTRAKAQGITGYVVLSLLISPTGQVEKVKVLESQPSGIFDDTAVAGVQGWRFEPASYQGESVRVWAKQKIRFDLG